MEEFLPILHSTALFYGLTDEQILTSLNCIGATCAEKPKDTYILCAGESVGKMGLMLSGRALVVQEDVWGHRSIIQQLTAGETFAEPFAAAGSEPLNVSVVADSDCRLLWLNVERILTVCPSACEHHNRIVRNLVSVLAQKLLRFNEKITHTSRRSTREKLLSYLSAEAIRQGSLCFAIAFDRQQLADYLCVERSAMSAELSRMQRDGILNYEKNRFVLHADPEKLPG